MQNAIRRAEKRSLAQTRQDRETSGVLRRACRGVGSMSLEGLELRQLLTLMVEYNLNTTNPGDPDMIVDTAPDGGEEPASLFGATRVTPGRTGAGAIAFDGTAFGYSDMYSTQIATDYLANSGSLAFWIKTTDVGGATAADSPGVMGQAAATQPTDAIAWGWIDNAGNIAMTVGGATAATIRSTNPINNGQWQHIVFTRDAATGQMTLYVNGVQQAQATGPTLDKPAVFRELGGITVGTQPNVLTGTLDEIRIYNHVLDATEAGMLFTGGVAPAQPSNLAVTGTGARAVALSWTSTADNESGFRIYQSRNGAAPTLAGTVPTDATTFTAKNLDPSTPYAFYVVAYNPVGESAQSNTVNATTTAANGVVGDGTGLTGVYYDEGGVRQPAPNNGLVDASSNFKGKIVVHPAEVVDFTWGSGAPDPEIAPDFFSTRWTGTIVPQYTERYTFFTDTDDGAFLYINDELVINDPTYHGQGAANERGSETLKPGGILLTAGQPYSIRLEQFEGDGGAGARLLWESLSTTKAVIPASQLFPVSQTTAPTGTATISAASDGPYRATLTITDPGVQNAIGYRLERRGPGQATFTEIARIADADTYVDGSVFPNTQYSYRIRAFNLAGDAGYSNEVSVRTQALPTGPGLLGSYHDDRLMSGTPEFVRLDQDRVDEGGTGVVNFSVATQMNTGVPTIDDANNISVRWEGTFTPNVSGDWDFFTRTDDDVRLYVNGQLLVAEDVIDNFLDGQGAPALPGQSGPALNLTAGVAYPIIMEYNQGGGGSRSELRVQGPGMTAPELIRQNLLNATITAPQASTGLAGTATSFTATLSWNDVAKNEFFTGLEQSTDGGLTWVPSNFGRTNVQPQAISNTGGNPTATTVTVRNLEAGTAYKFRVRSLNTAGEAFSNVLDLTTNTPTPLTGSQAASTGDTNLTQEGNISWFHWGHGGDPNKVNAPGSGSTIGNVITSVTVQNSDAAITGGVQAQRENDLDGVIVPFGEGVFTFTDRTHHYTNARVTAAGLPSATATDTLVPIPDYLLGSEYVSTMNGNRDNATFVMNTTVSRPVTAYLLIDNRTGGSANTTPPSLSSTVMGWVAEEGWTQVNTGLMPNGLPDMVAIDENNTPANWAARGTTADPTPGAGNGINQFFTIYSKEFPAGSTIVTRQANNDGQNMYGLVITARGGTNLTTVGTGATLQAADTPGKTFTWTGGFPDDAVTATDDAVAVAGEGNGMKFTVPASNTGTRRIKVYVGVDEGQGQLTATLSDGSRLPFVDSSLVDSGPGIKTAVYTISYRAELPGATLTIEWKNLTPGGRVMLSAATMAEGEPPATPTGLAVTPQRSGANRVAWTDVANNETGYVVQRKTGAAGAWADIATLNAGATNYTDNDANLVIGTEYFYRVRATGLAGDSDYSNEASVVKRPASPTGLFTDSTNGRVNLTWNAVPGATSYTLQRGTVYGTYTDLATGLTGTSFADTTGTIGTRYFYTLKTIVNGTESVTSVPNVGLPMEGSNFARVNFTNGTDDTIEVVPGYAADFGAVYALRNGFEYGWTEDNTATARDRDDNSEPLPFDERYDSLNHMQNPTNPAATPPTFTDRVWEIAVPNGTYYVRVVGGDIGNTDSNIGFNIEGTLTGLVPIRTVAGQTTGDGSPVQDRFAEFYRVVTVTDGKLTIRTDLTSPKPNPDVNTGNAGNNKIAFIDINQVFVPPAGINLTGTAGNDNWHLKLNGTQIEVRNNADGSGAAVSTHELGSDFSLDGGDGDDTVTVDMSGGDFNLGSFTITGANGTDKVALTNGDGRTLTLGGVPTLNGEYLDLGTGDLKIPGTTQTVVDALLKSAREGATRWQGPGIGTSSAGTVTGLASVQQGADVLVKFSYNGDANGDGRINADDYFRIDQGFLGQPANPTYAQGDFNFDDTINADDYFLIDQAFLGQGAQLGGGTTATATPVAAATTTTSTSAVVASAEDDEKKTTRRRDSGDSLFSSRRIEKRAVRRGR